MNQHPIFSEHPGLIIVFAVAVVIMLLLDLGIFNKKSHVVTNKEAITWSLVWISLAMIFSGLVYYFAGAAKFYEFQSAYWIEKALSVDNLFVFILVFKFFDVANNNKHKVLFWGIIGALVLRAIFIFSGAFLIELTYLNKLLGLAGLEGFKYDINLIMTAFGLFLVYAGVKSWSSGDDDDDEDYNNTRGARLIRKFFKVSDKYDGDKFFTYENGKKLATPLLVVVAVIEFTDLLFAVDSIPAIFAISNDPFILYTSNIFAILGLRALFFLLDNFIHLFSKLQYGLAIILSFIGIKMIISPFYHIESIYSLLVIGGVLLISVLASILMPEPKEA
ncbi:Inner membrane protein alx [Flavobacterium sp. ACN2]|jgi:tellurite resistance protein TerC|uniref:TerC/Alx family metal homeostasis membrane protein n=1 Tax=unclassified Flavobacterium TaxID=196869 RepID=UPI000BB34F58|nr:MULTISPECIES: TerC/Alx family metal homeostasis membrane protein [unclassified Flavobacterium]MDY0987129.1 TerC/Alx family metal homeostasis membrane protein [Flavobacterium sp. CFBP9031]PBI91649.1 Inner membrane protein alx [Flavobacterium sp. ACN2]